MKKYSLQILLLIVILFGVYSFYTKNVFKNEDKYSVSGLRGDNQVKIFSNGKEMINKEIITSTTEINKKYLANKNYINDVPFIVQAPNADWKDERQQDGCEEASVVIARAWLNKEAVLDKQTALKNILEASAWFEKTIGSFHDASVEDVIKLFKEYYKINTVVIIEKPLLDDLKKALSESKLVLVPTNGQLLSNPYFSGAGPERHMIVLRGYDDKTGEFIVNDPGTKRGENYRYSYQVVMNANLAYPTGFHEKINVPRKAVIVVSR